MRISKITYQKAFITGPFLQEKIGFEAEMSQPTMSVEGHLEIETPEVVLSRLKELAENFHKETNPHLYQDNGLRQNGNEELRPYVAIPGGPFGPPVVSVDKDNPVTYLQAIQGSQSLDELKQYKLIAGADSTKKLYNAYNKRLKELSI